MVAGVGVAFGLFQVSHLFSLSTLLSYIHFPVSSTLYSIYCVEKALEANFKQFIIVAKTFQYASTEATPCAVTV